MEVLFTDDVRPNQLGMERRRIADTAIQNEDPDPGEVCELN